MQTILKVIATLLFLLVGFLGFQKLKSLAPEKVSQQPALITPEAHFITLTPADYHPPIRSFGRISPYFESTLTPQITGRITEISSSFRIGEKIKKGTVLVHIDRTDFESALATQKSNLAIAQRSLAEEKIRANQAVEDWKASGRNLDSASPFVLRQPQLTAATANIEAAEAAIDKAHADLERTKISAPFDAIVTARSASLGNLATQQSQLGTLIATERVEVNLPLTAEQLQRITLPTETSPGPKIKLTTPLLPEASWIGKIVRTSPVITRDQVLTTIGEITNPFSSTPPLSIGTFVNVEIESQPIKNAYKIPEAALINDTSIWALDTDDSLKRLSVTRILSDAKYAFVRLTDPSLNPPLRIIPRPLTNFKSGMIVNAISLATDTK